MLYYEFYHLCYLYSYKKIETIYLLYYKRDIDTDNPTIRATINELMNGT